jgi:ribulose-phosphate 3-epimerase
MQMQISLGLKSDPIQYRYSYDWLFDLMEELDLHYLQLGSFPELYTLEDGFFHSLREAADRRSIVIKSCFTSYRELGGFFSGDPFLQRAARRNYERYIQIAALVGAESVGSNPGSVYRDRMEIKEQGIQLYLENMKELMSLAHDRGLRFLSIEPMSCLAEPPSLPEELDRMLDSLREHHSNHVESTVPVYLCADISHGVADKSGQVLHDNWSLFEYQIPNIAEFHIKNTDSQFNSTFGFSREETAVGIVELARLRKIITRNWDRFPVELAIGYLELGGPKLGRDYSDNHLRDMIIESMAQIREYFPISDYEHTPGEEYRR